MRTIQDVQRMIINTLYRLSFDDNGDIQDFKALELLMKATGLYQGRWINGGRWGCEVEKWQVDLDTPKSKEEERLMSLVDAIDMQL